MNNQTRGIIGKHKKMGVQRTKSFVAINDRIASILLLTFFMSIIASDYWIQFTTPFYSYVGLTLSTFAALIAIITHAEFQKFLNYEVPFYTFILAMYLLSILYNNNSAITYLLWYMKYIFAALALSRIQLWLLPTRVIFWTFSIYFLVQIYSDVNIRMLTIDVSRNVISIHLLLLCVLYILALEKTQVNRTWIPAFVSVFISVWTGCRSGIIATFVVLIGVILWICKYENNSNRKKTSKKSIVVICMFIGASIIVAGIILGSEQSGYYFAMLKEKQTSNFISDPRFSIIAGYLQASSSSIGNFLFGAPFHSVPLISYLHNNPHNSFLFAYGNFGLAFLIIIVFKIARALICYAKRKNIYLILLLGITIRSFTDVAGFYGIYDPLFYYFAYEYFLVRKGYVPSKKNSTVKSAS